MGSPSSGPPDAPATAAEQVTTAYGLDPHVTATVSGVNAGSPGARLVVLRGNSGSGKSSVAAGIRDRYGRGIALVGQDNLRRVVLREREVAGGANIALIDLVARFAARSGYQVVVEGILRAEFYAGMLDGLRRDHDSYFYYLHVPFEETVRRHAMRPQAAEFGRTEMALWYRELDLLPGGVERIVPAASDPCLALFRH
jgi:hypothetical protein